MANAKPCRRCGHSKGCHTNNNAKGPGRCKYRYAARNGRNLDTGIDGVDEHGHYHVDQNGCAPKHYQCLCERWLPEKIERYNKKQDRFIFYGYQDGLNANGEMEEVNLQ